MKKVSILFAVFLMVSIKPAFAYLDPGTGAMIAQLVVGGFAIVAAYFGHKLEIVKRFFRGKKDASPDDTEEKSADKN